MEESNDIKFTSLPDRRNQMAILYFGFKYRVFSIVDLQNFDQLPASARNVA
jgi:hypothetical protein